MFIETSSGGWANLDHVVEITSHEDDGERVYALYTTDERKFYVRTDEYAAPPFPVGNVRTVPAAPGYHRLRLALQNDGTPELDRQPIVAWLLDGNDAVIRGIALVAWEIPGEGDAIEYPDGRVVELFIQEWSDVESWITEEARRQREMAEWKAARGRSEAS